MLLKVIYAICIFTVTVELAQSSAEAPYRFKHIKLGELLRNRAKLLSSLDEQNGLSVYEHNKTRNEINYNSTQLNHILFPDLPDLVIQTKNVDTDQDETGPLYKKILSYLKPEYNSIGEDESSKILSYNKKFQLGTSNFSGFVWEKPFAHFKIGVDRQLSPDLFDDKRYIVSDKFILKINAYTFLHNLKDEGLIDLTLKQIGAFAGVEFTRVYRYVHFADSYNSGLTADYNKLFLSFIKFQGENYFDIAPGEFLTKSDYINIAAGGFITIPGESFSLRIGALVEKNSLATVSIQRPTKNDSSSPDELIRINYKKKSLKEITVEAELAVDFFKLVKLTLLSYEVNNSTSISNEMFLSFTTQDLPTLTSNNRVSSNIRSLLKLKRQDFNDYLTALSPYIVSKERRISENLESKYGFLLYGGIKKLDTDQVEIKKDGENKLFFKNRVKTTYYVKNPSYPLAEALLKSDIFTSLFTKYKYEKNREINMEYEVDATFKDLNEDRGDNIIVPLDGEFSLNINLKIKHMRTTKQLTSKYRGKFSYFIDNFTTLDPKHSSYVTNGDFIGPIVISTKIQISREGIIHFSNKDETATEKYFKTLCGYKNLFSSSSSKYCFDLLRYKFKNFIDKKAALNSIPLWDLRNFLISLNKYSPSIESYRYLFGVDNIFINGSFSARTKQGGNYKTFFKDGNFEGLGVIDSYKRSSSTGSKAPAIIE